jgi:hypothetical protein
MHIMALEPISAASIHKSLPSVCICIPPIVTRQRLGRYVAAETNTRNNVRIVGGVVFNTVHVSKEILWVCLCITLSLLDNGSVNTFPRQQRTVEVVVFFAVRAAS